ncbi:unnamed protein product [Arabidopsis halleri]
MKVDLSQTQIDGFGTQISTHSSWFSEKQGDRREKRMANEQSVKGVFLS